MKSDMREIEIGLNEQHQRIDKFLMKYMKLAPKSFIYKMLRKKNIKLNDKKAEGSEILKQGDNVKIFISDETINKFSESVNIKKCGRDFTVIYEDKNIIICGKPEGIIVHPDREHKTNTLNDQLLYYLYCKNEYDQKGAMGFVPSICNRLDLNTSGIVTMGKNLAAVQELNRGFRERLIDKYYITVVKGVVEKEGIVEGYLVKNCENNTVRLGNKDNGGDYIRTLYRPIKSKAGYSLLEVKLETGKSHQIRVCMKNIGYPIIGDRKYGDEEVNNFFNKKFGLKNQFLHSHRIVMNFSGGCLDYIKGKEFVCDMDEKKEKIIEFLFK